MTAVGDRSDPQPFDVCGPLPEGTTILEASAGTGKTYAIAALAARYVVEGHDIRRLMMVTFGRMASNELRLRVRERLSTLERALSAALSGQTVETGDEVERLLTAGSADQLQERRRRLLTALSDFDAATIATTHEFCTRMLDGLGVLGAGSSGGRFVEHLTDLAGQVARDVYLQRWAADGRAPFPLAEAERLARHVVEAGHTRLVPDAADLEAAGDAAERLAFCVAVRAEVARRRAGGRLVTYDDLLTRLRDALADPRSGPAAARRLRDRYAVVLVDEFQDTDPVQWEILRRAFGGHTTMVLIGDPKQAIYAFRGADVFSYLDARDQATAVATLATNWRADAPLTGALHALLGGAALGDPRIVVREVQSHHDRPRLRSADGSSPAPVRLRVLPLGPEPARPAPVAGLREVIAADLVADVTTQLTSGTRIRDPRGERNLEAGDLAVLVRSNRRGEALRDALLDAGVPAVMQGATSVYASAAAEDWLTLLTACEQPRQRQVRAAALTCFVGWTFARLATATEDDLTDLTFRVRAWGRLLSTRGVAALLEAVSGETGLTKRVLSAAGGERRLTDLRHLAQALHAESSAHRLGAPALVAWLREQMAEARGDAVTDSTRRLESDASAVQILTLHRSKGLEFPVVYLPEAWDRHVASRDEGQWLDLHDDQGRCVLDVGGLGGPGRADRWRRAAAEQAGEELRLLYVGLTRARNQVVTWWAPSANTPTSPLQRLLARVPGAAEPPLRAELTGDPLDRDDLRAVGFSLERHVGRSPVPLPSPAVPERALRVRPFDRTLDQQWRRTSYSALTAAAHGQPLDLPGAGSEPEPGKEDDEAGPGAGPPPPAAVSGDRWTGAGLTAASPMRLLPLGAGFGSVVHAVYEALDPGSGDLPAALREAVRTTLESATDLDLAAEDLAAALLPSVETPLGPLAQGRRLADFGRADRLAELPFELPLAGGDRPTGRVLLGELAGLLRRHLDPADPLAGYADRLDHPVLADQELRGYLTGSIDAVLRVHGPGGPTYCVVDYKTNWLGEPPEGAEPRLTVGDYTGPRMAAAMVAADYPLQALLYLVATHRLLRWRQRGYQPDRHLGGALYLFVRGMVGPDTPVVDGTRCGVFGWRPPTALVAELSDLLDGRAR